MSRKIFHGCEKKSQARKNLSQVTRIGRKIWRREARNFLQIAGIPGSTFQYYINGRMPSGDHLIRIHEKFGVRVDWLLTGEGEMTEKIGSYGTTGIINRDGIILNGMNAGTIHIGKSVDSSVSLGEGVDLLHKIHSNQELYAIALQQLRALALLIK